MTPIAEFFLGKKALLNHFYTSKPGRPRTCGTRGRTIFLVTFTHVTDELCRRVSPECAFLQSAKHGTSAHVFNNLFLFFLAVYLTDLTFLALPVCCNATSTTPISVYCSLNLDKKTFCTKIIDCGVFCEKNVIYGAREACQHLIHMYNNSLSQN